MKGLRKATKDVTFELVNVTQEISRWLCGRPHSWTRGEKRLVQKQGQGEEALRAAEFGLGSVGLGGPALPL